MDEPSATVKDGHGPSGRELLLSALANEPEDSRIIAFVIGANGELSGHYDAPLRIWEMQGILEFFKVQAEIKAANAFITERDPGDEDGDDGNGRVM